MEQIHWAVEWTEFLEGMQELADYKAQKPKGVTWDDVLDWFKKRYVPTDQFRLKDMAIQFDKQNGWVKARVDKLIAEGYLESYGNGLLRRPAIRLGEKMRLHPGVDV